MSDNQKNVVPSQGFFRELLMRIKLIVRLMGDNRVSFLLKILPVGTLIYLFSPIDLMSMMPLDDAAVVGLGFYLFIELAPADVVKEHMDFLRQVGMNMDQVDKEDVIDADFNEVDEE